MLEASWPFTVHFVNKFGVGNPYTPVLNLPNDCPFFPHTYDNVL